jgi:uroporphyrin-III C-methyltransferase
MASLLDPSARGRVILVGAGPGDPGLLTVRAVEALKAADVLVHDGLVDPRVLDLAPQAHRISVAKRRSKHTVPQDGINALIIAHVKTGAIVVRLKGGDPFIFGRGGEEVEAVRAAGLPVEVIPGVSAALGGAAEAMLPLTHRDWSSAVTFVAGQCKGLTDQDWSGLAGKGRTLVIYMGVATCPDIAEKLMRDGVAPDMPVAVLERATLAGSRAMRTLLADLGPMVEREKVQSPAIIVVGEVVALSTRRTSSPAGRGRPNSCTDSTCEIADRKRPAHGRRHLVDRLGLVAPRRRRRGRWRSGRGDRPCRGRRAPRQRPLCHRRDRHARGSAPRAYQGPYPRARPDRAPGPDAQTRRSQCRQLGDLRCINTTNMTTRSSPRASRNSAIR